MNYRILGKTGNDEKAKFEFLDFCYAHDSQSNCEGMGMTNIIANVKMHF